MMKYPVCEEHEKWGGGGEGRRREEWRERKERRKEWRKGKRMWARKKRMCMCVMWGGMCGGGGETKATQWFRGGSQGGRLGGSGSQLECAATSVLHSGPLERILCSDPKILAGEEKRGGHMSLREKDGG